MKKITKILCLSLLIMESAVATTNAQSGRPEGVSQERLAKFIEQDQKELQLLEDQKGPYTEITIKYAEKLKDLKGTTGNSEGKRKEVGKLKSAKDEEMRELLSKQQFETYLSIQKERWEKMKHRREK